MQGNAHAIKSGHAKATPRASKTPLHILSKDQVRFPAPPPIQLAEWTQGKTVSDYEADESL